jgi:protein O-mannosyl-transferase
MKIVENSSSRLFPMIISLSLAGMVFAVYWQVHEFNFVKFDDNFYINNNQQVKNGLNLENLLWAFSPTKIKTAYWHPLTWLSHMMDCQLFGLNAGAHHLMNLFSHIVNVTLLFMALNLMTDAPWKSGFAAALFALHPINVDSVAWIAERKNLLSTTFWMLTVLGYIRYARKPGIFRYLTVFGTLALGLLAKPMLVTLPCVLLLLDFWPLGRMELGQQRIPAKHPASGPVFQNAGMMRLVMEKIPFLALSIGVIVMSMLSLQANNRTIDTAVVPILLRIENALVSYVMYLWKMVWPINLSVFYPFPQTISNWQSLCAAMFLILVSAQVVLRKKRSPYLLTGWFWYMGSLAPVIGIVQGGLWPAMADRWAYIPLIGIFIIIAWGSDEIMGHWQYKQKILQPSAVIIICTLASLTFIQAGHWKNTTSLFEHALRVTPNSCFVHNIIGHEQEIQGQIGEAIAHYELALQIDPGFAEAHYNLGNVLVKNGKIKDAVLHFHRAIQLEPGLAAAYNNLANIFYNQGKIDEAIRYYQSALDLEPNNTEAHVNMANALLQKGQMDQAISHYLKAIQLNPNIAEAYNNLGVAYMYNNDIKKSIQCFRKAILLQPDYSNAINNLDKALLMTDQQND